MGSATDEVWTIARLLAWMQTYFTDKGLGSPRLDAELLIAHVLKVTRIYLYTHFDQPLTANERDALRALVRRRGRGEPVAYLRGMREFYGRDFAVTPAVLIPRPETEHVIEAALAWVHEAGIVAPRILDVGTGSGALAVTLAAELPEAQVTAVDISPDALVVAAANAATLGVESRVQLCHSDLLAALPADAQFDLIVANPPYVATAVRDSLARDVRDFEPARALFAGPEGLDVLHRLIPEVGARLRRPGLFLCEMGADQAEAVTQALHSAGPWDELRILADLQDLPRVALARFAAPV
jgi:release factor glutamine methyltransferase